MKDGALFTGFVLTGGTNQEPRTLDLTSFCVFHEEFKPLAFAPRAKRPNRVFPEASAGVNTGHGLLPFPNTPLGVTPVAPFDARLSFTLPRTASAWDDLSFRWQGSAPQQIADGGGVWFASEKATERRTVVSTTVTTNCAAMLDVTLRDQLQGGAVVTTRFHREGMSLVVLRLRESDKGVWPLPTVADFAAASEPSEEMRKVKPCASISISEISCMGATGMQRRGQPEEPVDSATGAAAYRGVRSCGGVRKTGYLMHPPYLGGTGRVFVRFLLDVPQTNCLFSAQVGKGDGGDRGDGIYYSVEVETDGKVETVASAHVCEFEWKPIRADLSKWRGRRVKLTLVADCGPQDNPNADWAAWGDLKLE